MYSADGIGRTGHRLLALTLLAVGALGLGLVLSQTGTPTGYLLYGLAALMTATILLALSLWTLHRPPRLTTTKPSAAKVPTPPLDPSKDRGNTLFEYDDHDHSGADRNDLYDLPPASRNFAGTVPRATVVDERPPPPPVPEVVRTRHDFAAKYTQSTPQVREILTHAGPQRPKRIKARLADPGMHPTHLPPATMRGKCGDCDALLLAPTQRPIELECPACARVTLLE